MLTSGSSCLHRELTCVDLLLVICINSLKEDEIFLPRTPRVLPGWCLWTTKDCQDNDLCHFPNTRLAQCEGPEVTGWHDPALPVEEEPQRPRVISALSHAGWGHAVGKTQCSGAGTNCPFNRLPTEQGSSTSIHPQRETSVHSRIQVGA